MTARALTSTVIHPLSDAFNAKLGRCSKCIRLSIVLTASSWSLLGLLILFDSPGILTLIAGSATAAFTALLSAHGLAYFIRSDQSQPSCAPCAAKAKARRRAQWRRRLQSFVSGRGKSVSFRNAANCQRCGRPRSLEEILEVADELPKADAGLRVTVESCPEFQSLSARLAATEPFDSWRIDAQNHFLYRLKSETDGENATALFVVRWEDYAPMSAVVITPDPNGGEPQIVNLRA